MSQVFYVEIDSKRTQYRIDFKKLYSCVAADVIVEQSDTILGIEVQV